MIFELILISIFQYPSFNKYLILHEMGSYLFIPISSILSAFTFLRFYFVLKIFKHVTHWTSTHSEYTCELHNCKADAAFAFKAFQKENPFIVLAFIFFLTCFAFGMALRIFELHYWETRKDESNYQNWEFALNGMWCIYVSLSTVGYGDYSARTIIGRTITITACIIGNYIVSMMMVYMTQKSSLSEIEKKSYNLMSRLKIRKEIENNYANIVYASIKMGLYNKKKSARIISEQIYQRSYCHHKRNIISQIDTIKIKNKLIQTFASHNLKEKLIKVSEQVESDIKEIRIELLSLQFISDTIIRYTESQIEIAHNLKKNCYATKLLYNIINNNPIYAKLNKVNQLLKDEFEAEIEEDEENINTINIFNDMNSQIEEEYEDNIFNYYVNQQDIQEYFNFIQNENKYKKQPTFKSNKTVDYFKRNIDENKEKYEKTKRKLMKRKFSFLKKN
jgi:hypothetical protein